MEDRKKENGTVVRVVKSKNYTTIDNSFLRLKNLSLKAKGLLTLCLSLPDNWSYSINGLITLSSDGRAAVTSALNELKAAGFLVVTSGKDEKGYYNSIYTFYETLNENPQYNGVLSGADFLHPINGVGLSDSENQQQINTNNKELKKSKENVLFEIEKFEPKNLFDLYKTICISFPQPSKFTQERSKKAATRLKTYPTKDYWQEVFKIAENSSFLKSEKAVWFNFDWLIKNDNNSLKVYEGNYGGKNQTAANAPAQNGDKYSKKYGGA